MGLIIKENCRMLSKIKIENKGDIFSYPVYLPEFYGGRLRFMHGALLASHTAASITFVSNKPQ